MTRPKCGFLVPQRLAILGPRHCRFMVAGFQFLQLGLQIRYESIADPGMSEAVPVLFITCHWQAEQHLHDR